MRLAKALKVKNRVAGEIAQLQRLISESNVREGDNRREHAPDELYEMLKLKQDALAALKGRIAVANGPIAEKIAIMAELKGRIAFLRSIPTKNGRFLSQTRYGAEPTFIEYHAMLKSDWVENQVHAISLEVERLQDELDEFNASTSV